MLYISGQLIIRFKPDIAGITILNINGGGIWGIILFKFLKECKKSSAIII